MTGKGSVSNIKKILLLIICLIQALTIFSQKKLLILGSSTAACVGPSVKDSCYVSRLQAFYNSANERLIIDNRAVSGSTIYRVMPSGFVPPPGRERPDTLNNITAGLSQTHSPDFVLVNFPSNGYDKFSASEVLNCFRIIKQYANSLGKACYITTTQPRSEGESYRTTEVKKKLVAIKDSILKEYGAFAINFWEGIVNMKDTTAYPQYSAGDGIHLNNAGHKILFERVRDRLAANFYTVLNTNTISIQSYNKNGQVLIQWKVTDGLEIKKFVIERSGDGRLFQAISEQGMLDQYFNDLNFEWPDPNPTTSSYYRIKLIYKDGNYSYSKIVYNSLIEETDTMVIYPNPVNRASFAVRVNVKQKGLYSISLRSPMGVEVFKRTKNLEAGLLELPIVLPATLPTGQYFLNLILLNRVVGVAKVVNIR